ncbi:MAG: YczE/YyaS/YitT family protein [Nitriliruptoraceae bacterium]
MTKVDATPAPRRRPIVRTVLWPTLAQWRVRGPRLVLGLAIIAVGVALMVRAEFGLAPYEVLNQGVSVRTPLTIGQASIVIGVGVLLLWLPLRQRPGFGTVVNVLGVGLMLDAWLLVVPTPTPLWTRMTFLLVGVVLVGLGIGLYIGAGLGPGPRDGLMTGLAEFGAPVWAVRLALESSALLLGWYLGGTIGIGTVAFAVGVPFLADWSLRRFAVRE